MLHSRAQRTTSIRRAAGATAIGVVIGASALVSPAAAEEVVEPSPVTISFYDYATVPGTTPDLAFFQWPEGYAGASLSARLLAADGTPKADPVEVLSYNPGTVKVEALAAGDVAELYDPETSLVVGRAVYDGAPTVSDPICAGSTSATGLHAAGEPIGNVEAFTPVEGAQSSQDIQLNAGTLADQPADGTSWTATFERPVAAGDRVNVFAMAMRDGVRVQSFAQRAVTICPTPAPAPATPAPSPALTPAPDSTPPAASGALTKGAKKVGLSALVTKGLTFSVTAKEDATLRATLSLKTKRGKGKKQKSTLRVVGTTTQPVMAGTPVSVKVKAKKKSATALKKAAKQAGSKLVVSVTLTDGSGNVTTLPANTISLPKR